MKKSVSDSAFIAFINSAYSVTGILALPPRLLPHVFQPRNHAHKLPPRQRINGGLDRVEHVRRRREQQPVAPGLLLAERVDRGHHVAGRVLEPAPKSRAWHVVKCVHRFPPVGGPGGGGPPAPPPLHHLVCLVFFRPRPGGPTG